MCERQIGIKVNHVILAGDSAGGNLISALTILIIKKNYKLPLSLIMSYPASYVADDYFAPSLLLSLDDILLPSKFLQIAMKSYCADKKDASTNDMISPLRAESEILAKFP